MDTWYYSKIYNVVDGDTFDAIVDLGFGLKKDLRIRLKDIDTPETWGSKNKFEKIHGKLATKTVKDLILNENVWIKFDGTGSFGRHLGTVWIEEKGYLHDILYEKDLAKYDSY